MSTMQEILDELEHLACMTEATDDCEIVSHVVYWETTKLTLRFRLHPDAIRERAAALKKSVRKFGSGHSSEYKKQSRFTNWKHSSRRPGKNTRIARMFLEDGEKMNHAMYCDLYETCVRPPIGWNKSNEFQTETEITE